MDIKTYTDASKIHNMIGGHASAHFADAALTDGTFLSELSASLAAISPSASDLFDALHVAAESENHVRYCDAVRQYATCKMALLILPEVTAEEPDTAHLEPSLEGTLTDLGSRVAGLYTAITNLPAKVPLAPTSAPDQMDLLAPASEISPAETHSDDPEV